MRFLRWLLLFALFVIFGENSASWARVSIRPCTKKFGEGVSLIQVVEWAFGMPEYLIVGPYWIREECVAWPPKQGKTNASEVPRPALQLELANQFHLAVHQEYRDIDVFILKLPVDGTLLKIQPDNDDQNGGAEVDHHSLKVVRAPISRLAGWLSLSLRRPVYDEIQMRGSFTFDLRWSGDDVQKAVKEQLGIDLISAKRPVDMLVIDHIERWTPK